ncbi:MAG: hypothetical protein JXR95_08200 [Deltaproteobacteria bacterium]|nr:hypothetical protein [Deltaproteobacteria bacterium]
MAFEGYVSEKNFSPEKLVLLDLDEGKTLWRKAFKPVWKKNTSLWDSFSIIDGTEKNKSVLSWVSGDVFRMQSIETGEDLWNRPDCKWPTVKGGMVIGYCMNKLMFINRKTGKVLSRRPLPFVPGGLWVQKDRILVLDERGDLKTTPINGYRFSDTLYNKKIIKLIVLSEDIYVFSVLNGDYFIEKIKIEDTGVTIKWSRPLNESPSGFWIHLTPMDILYPAGFGCIGADNRKTGITSWTSCGVFINNPPAWDKNGLLMLSSRITKDGERPMIFIDSENGLQTSLFGRNSNGNVITYTATFISPGKSIKGLIFAIRSKSKIFGLRISGETR